MNRAQKPIVITRLVGGLGNQMFQYATARRIAKMNGAQLKVDISWFDEEGDWTHRKYELEAFSLPVTIADREEIRPLKSFRKNPVFRRLPTFLKSVIFHTNQTHIIEKQYAFDPDILSVSGQVYLDGFWQSYKYFQDIEQTLRRDFSFTNKMGQSNSRFAEIIQSCDAISLHIRRGDYVTLISASENHGLCSLQYYEKAISKIKKFISNPVCFVFSDDIQWVTDNLKLNVQTIFIDPNDQNPHMDMYLMSLCKHHIIANSSFSWWGAWLGNNPDKIVIGPFQWFKNKKNDTSDLMPKEWIRI